MGTTEMTEDTIKRRARGLDRAFDILDFLKEIGQPLRPNEIASGIGSPKSTVYELVASLLERRILEPVGKDGHVYLGRQLYFLGQAHLRHFDLGNSSRLLHLLRGTVRNKHRKCNNQQDQENHASHHDPSNAASGQHGTIPAGSGRAMQRRHGGRGR